MSERSVQDQEILHSSGIDGFVGPGSGRPRVRVSCVAGFAFGDRFLGKHNNRMGAYGAMTALHPAIGGA